MKNKILHTIFSAIVTVLVLLPFVLQTLHAFEQHEHVYCGAENEKHFHKDEIDCHFYHLKITYNAFDFRNNFDIQNNQTSYQIFVTYTQRKFHAYQNQKSSRAPPYFIV